MNYSESSFAGPDITGRTFAALSFHHIGRWQEEQARLAAEKRNRQYVRRRA